MTANRLNSKTVSKTLNQYLWLLPITQLKFEYFEANKIFTAIIHKTFLLYLQPFVITTIDMFTYFIKDVSKYLPEGIDKHLLIFSPIIN